MKLFDVKQLFKKKGPMLEPLRKIAYFKRVFLEMGVLIWPNGFDICADVIYREAKDVKRTLKTTKTPAA